MAAIPWLTTTLVLSSSALLSCKPSLPDDRTVQEEGSVECAETTDKETTALCSEACDGDSPALTCSSETQLVPRERLSVGPDGGGGSGLHAAYGDGTEIFGEGPIAFGPHRAGDFPSWYPSDQLAEQSAPLLWQTIWGLGSESLTGYLVAPASGRMELTVSCDDYCSIDLGSLSKVGDNAGNAGGSVEVEAGVWYPVTLGYRNRRGSNGFNFYWSCPEVPIPAFVSDADTLLLFHFDEGNGTTLVDSGPHGLHGTVHAGTWVEGPVGGALALARDESVRIQAADALLPCTNQLTIEARVLVSAGSMSGMHRIWEYESVHGLAIDYGYAWFGLRIDDVFETLTAPERLGAGWHRIAGTYDGTTMKLWVNGIAVAMSERPGTITRSIDCESSSIGAGCDEDSWLDAAVDELRISRIARY